MPIRIVTIAALALTLVVPATAVAVERTVSVSGKDVRQVANDTASLGFSVSKERKSRDAALGAVAAGLRAVIGAVQGTPGVGPGDVTTGRISVRKMHSGERPLYRANEGISVVLHQPSEAGNLVSAAIRAGATGTSGPRFFVGDPEAAYNAALAAAFAQAKARATVLAAQAGATLGQALSIVEGGPISASPVSGTVCASPGPAPAVSKRCTAPSPPVKPGKSTVTATVQVVFALL